MTWRELRARGGAAIALLPVGSQEQHGGHLPMGTDTLLVEAVVDRALALLEADGGAPAEVVRLPALPFGHSPHHRFAAAVSLSAATLGAVLDDVLDSLAAAGFRRIMVVNGHGGNDEIMRLAVKRCALRREVAAAACSYWALGGSDGAGRPEVTPGHAGWFETSLMLAAHPELVRLPVPARRPIDPPPLFDRPPYPGLLVERHGEWERVGGTTDDASGADPERGRRLVEERAHALARAIAAFDAATAAPAGGSGGTGGRGGAGDGTGGTAARVAGERGAS